MMKPASFLAFTSLASLASAQCFSDIPSCAQNCFEDATASGSSCDTTDYNCQCTTANQAAIQSAATSCVISSCGADVAVQDVLPASSAFCEAINDGKTCDQSNNASSTSSWTVSETASSASLAASSNNGMIQSTTSASSSTSMSATSSITSSGSGVPNGPSPGSSGLTSAEKAGVGVGAGLGGVLLVALGFFLARIHSERTQDQDRTTGAESAGGGGLQHPAELVASPTIKPSELEQPPSRAHHDDMDWQDSLGQLPDQNVFEMTGSTPIRKPVELENFEKIANTDNIFGSIKPILV